MAHSLKLGGALMVAVLVAGRLPAQNPPATPSTFAIINARLIPLAGPVIERGTLVIRDGLIAAIGPDAAIPVDARMVDGSGLNVYPGLIDPFTSLGFAPPAPAATGNAPAAGGRGGRGGTGGAAPVTSSAGSLTDYPIGFQPELNAADRLAVNAAFAAAHSAGFTTALTTLPSGAFRGSAAIINLHNTNPTTMVIKSPVAQGLSFSRGGGGGYPASLMGVISQLRQELFDAQHYRALTDAYTRAPRGMTRPALNASLEALQPVLARELPVIMVANSAREIDRALDLAEEFQLRMVIAGGSEAYRVADRLRSMQVPVLYSFSVGAAAGRGGRGGGGGASLQSLRDQVEAPKAPALFARSGIQFAFTAGSNWADYLSNVRKAVDQGLLAEQALDAMITTPAQLFGVSDKVGTLEQGKIANLTLVRGDLFDRNATVVSLFIDGAPVAVTPATQATSAGGRGGRGGRGGGREGTALENTSKSGRLN